MYLRVSYDVPLLAPFEVVKTTRMGRKSSVLFNERKTAPLVWYRGLLVAPFEALWDYAGTPTRYGRYPWCSQSFVLLVAINHDSAIT